nr:MAG TPA: hypothetical protein [Caudoviricetes sp.]
MNLRDLTSANIVIDVVLHRDVEITIPSGMSALDIVPEWDNLVVDKIEVYDRNLVVTLGDNPGDDEDFDNEEIWELIPDDQHIEIDVWGPCYTEVAEGRKAKLLSEMEGSKLLKWPLRGVSSVAGEGYENTLLVTFAKQEE